jgi:hypothetical protein
MASIATKFTKYTIISTQKHGDFFRFKTQRSTESEEAMLKHRGFCTDTFGDTIDTESLLDTACVGSEGHYHDG